jgi:hypothetical protein
MSYLVIPASWLIRDGLSLMMLGTDGVLALDEWELVTDSRYAFSVLV